MTDMPVYSEAVNRIRILEALPRLKEHFEQDGLILTLSLSGDTFKFFDPATGSTYFVPISGISSALTEYQRFVNGTYLDLASPNSSRE